MPTRQYLERGGLSTLRLAPGASRRLLLLLLPRLTFFFAMLRTSSNIFSVPLFFLAALALLLLCDRLRPRAFTLRPDPSLSVA